MKLPKYGYMASWEAERIMHVQVKDNSQTIPMERHILRQMQVLIS